METNYNNTIYTHSKENKILKYKSNEIWTKFVPWKLQSINEVNQRRPK